MIIIIWKQQKPLNHRIGCEFTIHKVYESNDDMTNCLTTSYHEEQITEIVGNATIAIEKDEDRLYYGYKHIFIDLTVSTKHISDHTPERMKESVLPLEDELYTQIMDTIEKVKGSGWTSYRFNKMHIVLHTNKTPRAGSYIKHHKIDSLYMWINQY